MHANPSQRGMQTASDFRIGPVMQAGFALNGSAPDRQFYQLELRGESPDHGFSRIFLRGITLFEMLDLPSLNTENESIERTVRFHHQLITLGLESPLFYELTSPWNLEWGWAGGFTLARVQFKEPQKSQSSGIGSLIADFPEIQPSSLGQPKANPAQPDAQFAGGEVGSYLRYYGLYPLVPYVSGRLILGSFFDVAALVEGVEQSPATPTGPGSATPADQPRTRQRFYQSAFETGAMFSAGLETYLGSRGVLGAEYALWNWNWSRANDWTHFLSFKAGFLF
ncbi:MAG: hypothetical protein IGS03_07150 [Candidatus Sericytochromatia bacterium]|nr:hypothetical protein [Candidatus Sericytochromatia bacterium]